ncbi:MAG: rhamnulokinase [candidate division KSB1 bacterium]|nr:rhamnulokinase [candidate division KSB1 bacterium]MDZ7301204.1 rhamnulokinase [candidate division KSB1 bacterium]MDZ7310572.1 rhamnulokinase [candidate division KSB1 bacterium]
MATHHYIACDLGAESGRVMLGTLANERLTLEEIHRFSNGPVSISASLRWDMLRIFEELKTGLRKVAARGISVSSLSCDSWGVDYVLLQGNEPMLTAPFHYRDSRTDGGLERAFAIVPADEIFAETGIQFMSINTLYQLHSDLQQRPVILNAAERFLTIGDYFNFLFSGVGKIEESLASTTQLYNPQQRNWSQQLIRKFGFPEKIFPEIVPSGTKLGPLLPAIAAETKLSGVEVVAGCSHDTGAAVAAVPAEGDNWAYLSSGTWSLLGIESPVPIINAKSREYNFTNEVGFGGSIRFLKNITGLWIVQECRRAWAKTDQEYSYDQLAHLAEAAAPLQAILDLTDERFSKPGEMPQKIAAYCRETNQSVPTTPGAIVRCVLESLALLYRQRLDQLEELTGRKLTTLHIVGGGSKNLLLNQLSASATGRTVLAGPVECTAIGNVLIQAIALGHVASLASARRIVRDSFPLVRYEPQETELWEQAYRRFLALCV